MFDARCPGCGTVWKVPVKGKKYPCRGCGAMIEGTVESVTRPLPVASAPGSPRPRSSMIEAQLEHVESESRAQKVRAQKWLLFMALVFAAWGIVSAIKTHDEVAKPRAALAARNPTELIIVPGTGKTVTVGEVLKDLDTEVVRVAVIHGVLAASFFALSFWASSAPVPAAIVGLCMYLVIQVLNFIMQPELLTRGYGWYGRILFVAAMIKTISVALSEQSIRKVLRERQEREARSAAAAAASGPQPEAPETP